MDNKKIADFREAMKKRKSKKKWTIEEIKEQARKEFKQYEHLDTQEPDNLQSGDMDKIIRGEDNDEDE